MRTCGSCVARLFHTWCEGFSKEEQRSIQLPSLLLTHLSPESKQPTENLISSKEKRRKGPRYGPSRRFLWSPALCSGARITIGGGAIATGQGQQHVAAVWRILRDRTLSHFLRKGSMSLGRGKVRNLVSSRWSATQEVCSLTSVCVSGNGAFCIGRKVVKSDQRFCSVFLFPQ